MYPGSNAKNIVMGNYATNIRVISIKSTPHYYFHNLVPDIFAYFSSVFVQSKGTIGLPKITIDFNKEIDIKSTSNILLSIRLLLFLAANFCVLRL